MRGRRGRPLGRRGHPRPAALPRPAAARRAGAAHRHLPGRRPGRRRPAPASRSATWPRQRSTRRIGAGAAVAGRRCATLAGGSGLDAAELYRLTGGNPFYVTEVLRAGIGRGAAVGPRRGAGPGRPAERRGARGAGRRRADRRPGRAAAAGRRSPAARRPLVDELLASGLLVGDGAVAAVPARDRPAGGRAGGRRRTGAARSTRRILAALRSLGCDDDARLAFHAEARRRRRRRCCATRRAAARRAPSWRRTGRPPRSTSGPCGSPPSADPATLAGCTTALADELSLLDRWEDAADAGERALALWREAGDRLREGDTLRRLSRTHVAPVPRRARRSPRPRPRWRCSSRSGPSVELAWAYASLANQRMLDGDHDAAHRPGPCGPQAIAEPLGAHGCAQRRAQHPGLPAVRPRAATGPASCAGRWTSRSSARPSTTGRARLHEPATASTATQRRFAEAERYFDRGLGVLRRARHRHVRDLPARRAGQPAGAAPGAGTRRSRSRASCWTGSARHRSTGSAR